MRVYDGPLISTPQLGMEFLSLAVSSAPTHFAMPRGVTCFYSVMNGNVVFSGPVSSDWLFWHLFRHIPSLISDHFQSAINIFGYRMKTHAFLKLFPIVWGRNACMEELYSTLLQWSGQECSGKVWLQWLGQGCGGEGPASVARTGNVLRKVLVQWPLQRWGRNGPVLHQK